MSTLPPDFYEQVAKQELGIKYGFAAAFTAFAYDFVTTVDDEIEYIWKRKFSAVSFLFFLNRYYALFAITFSFAMDTFPVFGPELYVTELGSHSLLDLPDISRKTLCAFQPFGSGIPLTIFPDIVIGLRSVSSVYALYGRNAVLGTFLVLFLLFELGVSLWIYLTPSWFVPFIPGPMSIDTAPLRLCIVTPSPKLSNSQVASFQIVQTVYDTIVLSLIIVKSIKELLGRSFISPATIRAVIVKHGLIYYVVVITPNTVWVLMILLASERVKYSAAAFALALAPLSANRLTISLRKYNEQTIVHPGLPDDQGGIRFRRRTSWMGTSTFEISEGPTTRIKTHEDIMLGNLNKVKSVVS